MKYIEKKSIILVISILIAFGFGLTSCNNQDISVITPKTLAEYKLQLSKFIASEKATVDSAKVGFNKGNFKTATDSIANKTSYKNALIFADSTINKPTVTLSDIVATDKSLSIVSKAFWTAIYLTDRRPLNDSIVKADALNAATISGSSSGQVLADAKTTFSTAITAAKAVRSASATVDRQVKTANVVLLAAKKVFLAAIIPSLDVYQQKSIQYVASQKAIVENGVAGYNVGEYNATAKTAYQTVLTSSEALVNNAGATFADISSALQALVVPRKAFLDSRSLVDRRPLNDSITAADAFNTTIMVGTTKGLAPQVLKTVYTTAITTARTILNTPYPVDTTTTKAIQITASIKAQQNITSAVYNLGDAKRTLLAGITLSDLIIDSEALKAATPIGSASGQVSVAVNTAFSLAITAAKKTRDLTTSTYVQIITALSTLKTAQTLFQSSIIK